MGKIIKIDRGAIRGALEGVRRQYLVGNLKMPQALEHIKSHALEIGISSYKTYTVEPTHMHSLAVEYQYVISGWTKYIDTDTMEEFEFREGDFYAIESGVSYAQKCKAGTEILFIKVPSINDKIIVENSPEVEAWIGQKLSTIRTDYSHQEKMPEANSVRPAAAVAIVKDGCILMLKRRDNGKWTMPGGTMEMTESLIDCAIREVKEECSLDVKITDIIGTYTDPDVRIEYSDGEVRREFSVVYFGTINNANVVIDDESSAYQWFPLVKVLELPMAESQKTRINDVISYLNKNIKVIR